MRGGGQEHGYFVCLESEKRKKNLRKYKGITKQNKKEKNEIEKNRMKNEGYKKKERIEKERKIINIFLSEWGHEKGRRKKESKKKRKKS